MTKATATAKTFEDVVIATKNKGLVLQLQHQVKLLK
jgi:hypothetical protein